jgi:hypothetical protein
MSAAPAAAPLLAAGVCTNENEAEALACARGRAWRHEDTLFVRPDSGPVITYREHPSTISPEGVEGTDAASYQYVGAVVGRPGLYHLVRERLYEMENLMALNGRTGRHEVILDLPLLSPDGTRLAASTPMMECEQGDSGLEVWRMTDSTLVNEFRILPLDCSHYTGWAPSEVTWISPDTLRFIANVVTPAEPAEGHLTPDHAESVTPRPARLVRSGSGWTVVGDTARPPARAAPDSL